MPPFTLQLVSLRCVTAQENAGDEIYINLDGRTVWSVGVLRMHQSLSEDNHIDEVDFIHGRLHTRDGWVAMQSFEASDYRAEISADEARIHVYERDLLLSDDLLGEAVITAADATAGNRITLAFTAEGAHYMLAYQATPG